MIIRAKIGHPVISAWIIVLAGLVLPAPPDLAASIRPELDRLTPALLASLQPALSALRRDGLDALITASNAVPAALGPALAVTPVIEAARKVP